MRFVVLVLTVITSIAFAGPGSGGGGGTGVQFHKNQCFMLLDVLTIHPEYENSMDKIMGRDCGVIPKKVTPYPEFEDINAKDRQAIERALSVLNRDLVEIAQTDDIVHRAVFAFIANVRNTLKTTSFMRTGHEFEWLEPGAFPKNLQHKRAKMGTVALHLPRFGVLLSSPSWDILDVDTQAMFLVHETVRQFQEEPSVYGLKDAALQTMVALMFEPHVDLEHFVTAMATAPRLIRRYATTGRILNGTLKSYIDPQTGIVRDIDFKNDLGTVSDDPALKLVLGLSADLDQMITNGQKRNVDESFKTATQEQKAELIKQLIEDKVLSKNHKWVSPN